MYRVEIDDVVANAFIEVFDKGIKEISYKDLNNYAETVKAIVELDGDKEVKLVMGRNYTDNFLFDYREYFEEIPDRSGIRLKNDVSKGDLIKKFRGYINVDVLMAFMNKDAVSVLV